MFGRKPKYFSMQISHSLASSSVFLFGLVLVRRCDFVSVPISSHPNYRVKNKPRKINTTSLQLISIQFNFINLESCGGKRASELMACMAQVNSDFWLLNWGFRLRQTMIFGCIILRPRARHKSYRIPSVCQSTLIAPAFDTNLVALNAVAIVVNWLYSKHLKFVRPYKFTSTEMFGFAGCAPSWSTSSAINTDQSDIHFDDQFRYGQTHWA